jgi:hypothetical protein
MPADNLEERLSILEARLEKVESIQIALGALRSYVDAVDAVNLDALTEVFTDDAVLDLPGAKLTFTGNHDVVQNFYKNAFIQDPTVKRHFIINSKPEWLSPGVVRIPSYFIFVSSGPDQSLLGWGTYLDEVRITDGVAKFQRKQIIVTRDSDVRTGWPLEASN